MLQSETLTLMLCFLHVVYSQSVYKKVGDEVVLSPDMTSVTAPITSIMWKVGPNIAVQWEESDESDITYFRHFKERGSLNTSSGAMTIKGLIYSDSALYTPEINSVVLVSIPLSVLSAVPVPSVTVSCDEEKSSCILTCEGNTTGLDQLTYVWKFDNEKTVSSKLCYIGKDNSSMVKEFSCELENPVSWESSRAIGNPLTMTGGKPVSINTGLTVFICMLCPVLILVFVHRWRAGMWFFQKDSMPWEADFWRRQTNNTETEETTLNKINKCDD
ncbi:carcinoembryonic antigen-related cell adhesion molecule 7-like isoform X2 [Cynoglossus semilaevis]|uniref:carcinoembryonic antigen-related cell adhesion molecule 7-like isoform X2 n=1 Tax=Cynoglossus semilaevis TaxID=244447 RepID=UPI0004969E2B|nr:carcinoembryonic antigen-related cell adhesion molecule 7-like isoform X2 [Cynoglossus semilaevis]